MKKILSSLFCIILLFNNYSFSQDVVKKVELYVIPLNRVFKMQVQPNKVKKYYTTKITIKEASGVEENDDFLDFIKNLNGSSMSRIAEDYRIVCVVHKLIGKEVLYFNQFGDFLYNGKTYKNEKIKLFVLKHLPENCK